MSCPTQNEYHEMARVHCFNVFKVRVSIRTESIYPKILPFNFNNMLATCHLVAPWIYLVPDNFIPVNS